MATLQALTSRYPLWEGCIIELDVKRLFQGRGLKEE